MEQMLSVQASAMRMHWLDYPLFQGGNQYTRKQPTDTMVAAKVSCLMSGAYGGMSIGANERDQNRRGAASWRWVELC